jgi:hypothetical protein
MPLMPDERAMAKKRFIEATDRLKDIGVSLMDVAAAFQINVATLSRWRREDHHLVPSPGWERLLAEIARNRAFSATNEAVMARELADELDPPRYHL